MLTRHLTNNNFLSFAQQVAAPSDPTEYNAAAVKRLMEYLDPYIVDVKGIRFKHHAKNKIELINFTTEEEAQAYANAWEDYQKRIALLEEREAGGGGRFQQLVEFLKFRQAAELIRCPYLARRLYDIRNKRHRSAVAALNFRESIAKITSILCNDYGVPRGKISLIWGGLANKAKKKPISPERLAELKQLFTPEELSFLKEQGVLEDEPQDRLQPSEKVEVKDLKLGTQSKNQRQNEIDRFQNDESDYCLFTFKSGGVGLSLHQELPNRRQREALIAPTYSAIELVQGLGRCARFTSCSDTDQTLIFYAGTVEYDVAMCVSNKLRCLKEVVRQKESWEKVILSPSGRHVECDIAPTAGVTELRDSEDGSSEDEMVGGEVEEDEE